MKSKILSLLAIFSVFFLLTGSQAWARYGSGVEERQIRQFQRIGHGLVRGDLTRWEYKRLTQEQWRIQRAKKYALRDGWLDKYERARLHRMQNRASRHIYHTKHNRARQRSFHARWHSYCPPRANCAPRLRAPVVWPRPAWAGYSFGFGGYFSDPDMSFGWSIRLP